MSVSLIALPPELISCIVANIESQPTLCNLAQCSRQLYLSTIPHLYRHVTVQETIGRGYQGNGRLRNLASLLSRRPHLAGLVRYFSVHVHRPLRMRTSSSEELKGLEEDESPNILEVDQAFETAVSAWSLPKWKEKKWLKELGLADRYHHHLILALLLPALLKVEKLALELGIGREAASFEEIIQKAARRDRPLHTRSPFEALTAFVHSHDVPSKRDILSASCIASFLKLPAIQEISGGFWSYSTNEPCKDLIELDSFSSPLTSLDLTDYGLSKPDPSHILRAPKALKS